MNDNEDEIKADCIFVRGRGWIQKDELDDELDPQEVRWGKKSKKEFLEENEQE